MVMLLLPVGGVAAADSPRAVGRLLVGAYAGKLARLLVALLVLWLATPLLPVGTLLLVVVLLLHLLRLPSPFTRWRSRWRCWQRWRG